MYDDTVECPYCEHENDMTDALADLADENIFDTECESCEEEFEVEVEFIPSYSSNKIILKTCEECGTEDRNYKERRKVFPFPKSSNKNVLCYECFIKFLGKDYQNRIEGD